LKSTTSRSSEHNVASFDPVNLPVDAVAGESALEAARLNADWLRQRFADPPRWEPEHSGDQMARWPSPRTLPAGLGADPARAARRADGAADPAYRPPEGSRGPDQLPRRPREDYDGSAIDTALRETEEEIGLARQHVEVSARCRITSPAPVIASRRWPA
jgi:hypothetical protein